MFVVHDHHTVAVIRDSRRQRVSVNRLATFHLGWQVYKVDVIATFFQHFPGFYDVRGNDKRAVTDTRESFSHRHRRVVSVFHVRARGTTRQKQRSGAGSAEPVGQPFSPVKPPRKNGCNPCLGYPAS